MSASTSPATRRDELEKIIERGLSTFVEVGNAPIVAVAEADTKVNLTG
jgi:hypothetical protein